MARDHARIQLAIWADPDFRDLPAASQWLYLYLLTSPAMSYAGVTDWRPARIAPMAADISPDGVEAAAVELEQNHYIVVDRDTEEVLIRSFIRHDGLMNQPNVAASMVTAYRGVASRIIQAVIVHELTRLHNSRPELKAWTARSDVRDLLTRHSMTPEQALDLLPRHDFMPPPDRGSPNPSVNHSGNGRSNPSGNPRGDPSPNPSVDPVNKGQPKGSDDPSPNPSGDPSVNPCPTPYSLLLTPSPTPTPPNQVSYLTSPETQKSQTATCPNHPRFELNNCPICSQQNRSKPARRRTS